jgi:EpsI family protein
MRLNLTTRVCLAAATLLGIFGAAESLKWRGMPTEVAHPQFRLKEMPRRLGTWTGEDEVLDADIFKHIGAQDAINRTYRDQRGNVVATHSAMFVEYGVRDHPHSPEECYPAAGFRIVDSRDVYLASDKQSARPTRLLTLERNGEQVYCLFWYQFDNATFCDGNAERRLVLGFRGRKTWPLLIKVMLQTSGVSPERAERQLKDLAEFIFAWTKDFH